MMNTKEIDAMLTFSLNEQRASEDVWHELSTGALSAGQVETQRRGIESKDELADRLALFAPASEEHRRDELALLRERYFPPASESGDSSDQGEGSDDADVDRGTVISLGRGLARTSTRGSGASRRSIAMLGGVLAVAAALLLVWFLRASGPDLTVGTMPSFELRMQDGWSGEMRDPAEPSSSCDGRYHRDQVLSVRLRPAQALDESLDVAAFARPRDGEPRWLRLSAPRQGAQGVVTIEQPLTELGLTPGEWTLTFFMTPKGRRYDLGALLQLAPGAHPEVSVVAGTVCIVE